MNFTTNKEKGNSGLGIAIAYFTSHGYIVLISKKTARVNLTVFYYSCIFSASSCVKYPYSTIEFITFCCLLLVRSGFTVGA